MRTMMLCVLTIVATVSVCVAEDLSSAFEGDKAKRERLAELQGTADPPTLAVTDWFNAEPMTLENLRGKIVVLDFWATWCGPCIRSIPHSNEIHKKHGEDVVFIGVCHPKGAEKVKDVIKEHGIEYPIAIDRDGKTIEAFKVNGYPDYYIIDRAGKLVVADCANAKVEEVLEKLLKEP